MADPVFLITGASSGIGEATARRASEAGFRVVLAARRAELLEQLAEELSGAERALPVRCDGTEWADQQALAETALSRFGRIEVAFANAGFGAQRGFSRKRPSTGRAWCSRTSTGRRSRSERRSRPSRSRAATCS